MKLSDFDYTLPKDLIAQYPSERRGDDRFLVCDRGNRSFEERRFSCIADYFDKGDLLVLNDTKVMPARLFGKRETGGKAEIFILDKKARPIEALVRPSGRIKKGETITLESGNKVRIGERMGYKRVVDFDDSPDKIMDLCGHVPLPPYISRKDEASDRRRYQTVFAKNEGATASPTAGLHFTEETIGRLKEKGVEITFVTLHVSYGTFAPVKVDTVESHKMHSEYYFVSERSRKDIKDAIERKAKIFACGTTSLRVLESYANSSFKNTEGFTDLFIYPGYKFSIVNALITNFHLPKSTLILLTAAFAGKELLFKAYEYAIWSKFRFFSYGDAMLIY